MSHLDLGKCMIHNFRRRLIQIVAFTTMLGVGTTLVLVVSARLRAERDVRAAMADIAAVDPNWTFEAIASRRPDIVPEKNGASRVEAVAAVLPRDWPRWHRPPGRKDVPAKIVDEPAGPDLLADIHKELNEKVLYRDARLALDVCAAELLRIELHRAGEALKASQALDQCLEGRFKVDYRDLLWGSSVDHFLMCRSVAELLQWDGVQQCQRGDAKGACRAALRIAAVARALGDELSLMDQRLRMSITSQAAEATERGLSVGAAESELLKRLQEVFEDEDRDLPGRLLHAARAQRALTHRMLQAVYDGRLSRERLAKVFMVNWETGTMWRRHSTFLSATSLCQQHAAFLREATEEIEAWQRPWDPINAPAGLRICLDGGDDWYKNFLGTLENCKFQMAWRQATLRCAATALACERYRMDHGRWPKALPELTPQYLKEIPRDPYRQAPIQMVRKQDGLVAYSVGRDGVDDGGVIDRENIWKEGTDFGVTLIDLANRKLKQTAK